ncbi:speckle-type POZ protein-like [Oppia nitens]|uniref:speckle-type POZ protein-like n=1 Tax=Oppia nitens TaxID=1686743 RepID=UPI0023DA6D15|nr:speckle-type POZ protein-like [Oppia nitens]
MADQSSVNNKMANLNLDPDLYPELDYLMNAADDDFDVQFVIDGQSVPAHISFMKAKSEVFRSMFSGQWPESGGENNNNSNNKVVINDTTPEAFKVMLIFIYTERLVLSDGKDLNHIRDVLKLADRYQLKRLAANVGQHLKSMSNYRQH